MDKKEVETAKTKKTRYLGDMVVLMICGHPTQVVDEDGKPICMICFPKKKIKK